MNIREASQVRYQAEGNAVLRNGQTLKLGDTLVVDGILLLPEDLSEEERNRLAETIGGTGTVQTGNTVNFIITFDLGDGTVEKRLLTEGSTFTLPPDPVRSG